jgi:hypothetical protein
VSTNQPTDILCEKHDVLKYRDSTGHLRCRICKRESTNKRYQRHKESIREKANESRDPIYTIWDAINQRCYNPNCSAFIDYGAIGTYLFEPWRRLPGGNLVKKENVLRFSRFKQYILENLGPKKEQNWSIDRIDTLQSYLPNNLRWATPKEQCNNQKTNKIYKESIPDDSPIYYPYNILNTIDEFAKQTGIYLIVVKYRYAQNWDAEWILDDEWDCRYFIYENHKYNLAELSLISKYHFFNAGYSTIQARLKYGWSVKEAVEKPLRDSRV